MKKTFIKMVLMLSVLTSMVFISCDANAPEDETAAGKEVIQITDAKSLAKALECDVSDFVYEAENAQRAAIGADKQNDIQIDVNKMLKTMFTTSASFTIINTIAASSDSAEFDKDIKVNITTVPAIFETMIQTTGLSPDYFLAIFNSATIKMHKFSDSEYEIQFNYKQDRGRGLENMYAYIYVIGTSSDNLVSWYFEDGTCERTKKTASNIEIVMEYGRSGFMYTKIGNKDSYNYCEYASIYDGTIESYGSFNKDKGYVVNKYGDELYYGLSDTKPSLICTNRKMVSDPESVLLYCQYYQNECYNNTYFLKDKNTSKQIYEENYYSCFHAADDGQGICMDYANDPLYYSSNKKFYGVPGTEDDLTDEAKAVVTELKTDITAKQAASYNKSDFFTAEEYTKVKDCYEASIPKN